MQTTLVRRASVKPNLEYVTKLQRRHSKLPVFRDYISPDTIDIPSEESCEIDYVPQLDASCQFTSSLCIHQINTDRRTGVAAGVNHVEGGWPKDVHHFDLEQTLRYRKKNEKDENFIQTILQLGRMVEHGIQQNNALNMLRNHFPKKNKTLSLENEEIRLASIFRESPCYSERSVSGISWSGNRKLAVAYSHVFNINEQYVSKANWKNEAIVWDVANCSIAELTLNGPSAPVCVEFNNKDPNGIIGGCCGGQVAYWDTRRGSFPVEMSDDDGPDGHRDVVRSVVWLSSKTGTEFFSGSIDGQVCWWDIRKMNQPTDYLFVDPSKTTELQMGNSLGVTLLEFEPTMSTKFMIGTEVGVVFVCNSKAKTMGEKLAGSYNAHLGPIRTLQRNPLFPKNFLTVGDWSAKIWSEDVRESSVIWTGPHMKCLTGGCWNPTKPSIYFTITQDGHLEMWDLLVYQYRPVKQIKVSDKCLTAIRVQDSGHLVACGSVDGSLALVDIGKHLTSLDKNEKSSLTAMLERETRREKILEARLREQKALQRSSNINAEKTGNKTTNDAYQTAANGYLAQLQEEKQNVDQ
ncbi:hypothetical protein CHUAL_004996 [Chamberlinius hualienensis]